MAKTEFLGVQILKKIIIMSLHLLFFLSLISCTSDKKNSHKTSSIAESANDMLAQIQRKGIILVSTDPNYEPQSYLTEQGEFVGFDIDVAKEIGKRLGVKVKFGTPDWDLVVAGNWGGQWDMSVGSMAITTRRQEILDFAQPPYYYTVAQFAATDSSGINALEDVNGQSICVCVSTVYEDWLNGIVEFPKSSLYANPPMNITVIPLKTDNECVQSIQAGREEFAIFLTSNTIVEAAMKNGIPVHKVGHPVFAENLAVAFDKNSFKDNTRLVKKVSEIIIDMHEDETLSTFSIKWFKEDRTKDPSI